MGLKKQRNEDREQTYHGYTVSAQDQTVSAALRICSNIPINIFNTEVLLFLNICWLFLGPLSRVSSYSCGSFQTLCPFARANYPTWNILLSLCFWWRPNDWAQMTLLLWSHPSLELPRCSLHASLIVFITLSNYCVSVSPKKIFFCIPLSTFST